MMKLDRIVALVPMRHHSQRVPGKNYRLLAGKPLFQHILDTLLSCPEINKVVIDTDSPVVSDILARDYPQVRVLVRPEELRADTVPMNEILLYDTAQEPADLYLQTHSTNPLLKAETISCAIRAFLGAYPANDSLFSVTRLQTRLYDARGKARAPGPLVSLNCVISKPNLNRLHEMMPLAEDLENYDVQILDGTTVKRTLTSSTTSVLYAAAQQTADWGALLGPGDTLDIRIFQLSALVGRGTPKSVTLTF